MADRTLVLCKPDCVERGLVGEVVARLERKQLKIVALELRLLDEATAKRHYAEHEGKPFFGDLVAFITRSPLVALVAELIRPIYSSISLGLLPAASTRVGLSISVGTVFLPGSV